MSSCLSLRLSGSVAAVLLLFIAAPLRGQAEAAVVPAGGVRLDVGGVFTHSETRFGPEGAEPFGAWYRDLIAGAIVGPAAELRDELTRFFAATDGVPVELSPDAITLGDPVARFQATTRHVPIRLAVGILPRVELTLALPIERDELLVQAVGVSGGTLGRNPDREANAVLLAGMGEEWAALGGSLLLPTEGSAAGQELARRVRELTGGEVDLPESGVDASLLRSFLEGLPGADLPPGGLRPWRSGDLEVGARLLVLSSFGLRPYPEPRPGAVDFRATASGAVRLPTSREVRPLDVFTQLPSVGHSGFRAGVDADLFLGRRFWISGGAGLHTRSERTETGEHAGEPVNVVWSPARELTARAAPRYRLTESIALGARYELARSGSTRREWIAGDGAGFLMATPGGLVQRAGFEIRYSTLPVLDALPARLFRGPLAAEVGLGYLQTVSGPDGVPAAKAVFLRGSLLHRLWGGRPDRAAPAASSDGRG